MLVHLIDEGLADARGLMRTLEEARAKPHLLDDHTVDRIFKVYGETREDIALYREQLARWREKELTFTPVQRREVARLSADVEALGTLVDSILSLAQELKAGTIDRVLARSDLDLGLDVLMGRLPAAPFPPDSPLDADHLTLVSCPRCGATAAILVEADDAPDPRALAAYAVEVLHLDRSRLSVPTLVLGPPISGPWPLRDRPRHVLQVWPETGAVERMAPGDLEALIDRHRHGHCSSGGSRGSA